MKGRVLLMSGRRGSSKRLSRSASRLRCVPSRIVHCLDELCRIIDMDKMTCPRDDDRCDIRFTAFDVVVQSHQPW